jgi:hypothetical protein
MCASLVSFGDFAFYFGHCSLWHTGPPVKRLFLGRSMMGDGEAVCFGLFSLWLEKLMLSHGAFIVVIEKSCNVCDA